MAEAEYKILVRTWQISIQNPDESDAEQFSADVTAHLRNGWSLHGSLSVVTHGPEITTFTQALFKPSGTTPVGTKPVVTKRQRK